MGFQDVNIDNWIVDNSSTSNNQGKCGNIDESLKYPETHPSPPSSQTQLFDYYVCGESDDAPAKHGYCKGLKFSEWTEIWANCHSNADPENYDKCWNMVTTDTYEEAARNHPQGPIGCAMRTQTDDVKYDPLYGQWKGEGAAGPVAGTSCSCQDTLGFCIGGKDGLQGSTADFRGWDNWSSNWTSRYGKNTFKNGIQQDRPAYPNDNEPLDDIGGAPDSQKYALETAEDITPHACPSSYRSFKCAGDGSSEDNGDKIPGCGTGREWNDQSNSEYNGHQDTIRFCARSSSDYSSENLMKCCLKGGDIDNLSNRICPTGYCMTKVDYTDALENNRCKEATGTEEYNQHCYEMTSECNTLFKEQCTADLFSDTNSNNNDKRTACRKWAKIQPAEFETFASSICSIQKNVMGSNYTGQETNEELITSLRTDTDAATRLVKIFKSDLCRDWLVNNGQMKLLLSDICSIGVVKDNDDNIKVTRDNVPKGHAISNELSDICHCYWTEEYYTWYKENVLSEEERNSVGQNKRPECYHTKCMLSGIYTAEDNTECPSIINCRNEINTNILSVGNKELNIDEEAIARLSSSQSCNIETVNQQNTTPSPGTSDSSSTGGTTSTTSGGSTSSDSSTGGGEPSGDATTNGGTTSYDGSGTKNPDDPGTSSNDPEDNTTMWIIIGVSVAILVIMILVIASGGKTQMPGMPSMSGMYNPYMR